MDAKNKAKHKHNEVTAEEQKERNALKSRRYYFPRVIKNRRRYSGPFSPHFLGSAGDLYRGHFGGSIGVLGGGRGLSSLDPTQPPP